jgi:hypothetical protein
MKDPFNPSHESDTNLPIKEWPGDEKGYNITWGAMTECMDSTSLQERADCSAELIISFTPSKFVQAEVCMNYMTGADWYFHFDPGSLSESSVRRLPVSEA